jgi:hypothetical protein
LEIFQSINTLFLFIVANYWINGPLILVRSVPVIPIPNVPLVRSLSDEGELLIVREHKKMDLLKC